MQITLNSQIPTDKQKPVSKSRSIGMWSRVQTLTELQRHLRSGRSGASRILRKGIDNAGAAILIRHFSNGKR